MNNIDNNKTAENARWQLTALTEALGDLTLPIVDSMTVGRGKDNNIVLGSKQVSRQHAELNVLNNELFVKDLGSSNGTLVNDRKLEANKSKHLNAGDVVKFSVFEFKVSQVQPSQILQQTPTSSSNTGLAGTDLDNAAITAPTSTTDDMRDTETVTTLVSDSGDIDTGLSNNKAVIDNEIITDTNVETLDNSVNTESIEIVPIQVTDSVTEEDVQEDAHAHVDAPVSQLEETSDYPRATKDVGIITEAKLEAELEAPIPVGNPDQNTVHLATKSAEKADGIPAQYADEISEREAEIEALSQLPKRTSQDKENSMSSPQHRKDLIEDADPDVLKAREAATGQLSGINNTHGADDTPPGANTEGTVTPANKSAGEQAAKQGGKWLIWGLAILIIFVLIVWMVSQM